AEPVRVGGIGLETPKKYDLILDRISQDIPFYRAFLKKAAFDGTIVVNDPFWWSADDKFFNNVVAKSVGVAVPKTVLLPSNQHPPDTTSDSMSNLMFPLEWEEIFTHIGFPAFFKPHSGGGWKNVYRVMNPDEFFTAYRASGQHVMILQEEIVFEEYFRCYVLGARHVRVMRSVPRLGVGKSQRKGGVRATPGGRAPEAEDARRVAAAENGEAHRRGRDARMTVERPAFTLGVEEEFQIIDPETRELRSHVQEILDEGKLILKERVKPEMHTSVIEVGTGICKDISEVRRDVIELRTEIISLAQKSGMRVASAGTHPFSNWEDQTIYP